MVLQTKNDSFFLLCHNNVFFIHLLAVAIDLRFFPKYVSRFPLLIYTLIRKASFIWTPLSDRTMNPMSQNNACIFFCIIKIFRSDAWNISGYISLTTCAGTGNSNARSAPSSRIPRPSSQNVTILLM